jgi:hypothetical protein
VSCTHASTCPLFPLLNASLASWRESYCDDAVAWQDCARYKRSIKGRPVPLALLPNGKIPVSSLPGDTSGTAHLLADDGSVATLSAPRPAPAAEPAPVAAPAAQESPEPRQGRGRHEDPDVPRSWWQRLKDWLGGAA